MSRDVEQFDVVIVGARCAGSPLATTLARRGLKVCVLDRADFPSETLSTHAIQPCGVAILDRLGVLDALYAAGAVPLTLFTMANEEARLDAEADAADFGAPALCMRRITLDKLLVDAAADAGAEVRTGTRATGLLEEDGRVTGVETKHGALRAHLVVGADGRHSTVAELVGAAEYHVAPAERLFSWAYFEGANESEGHIRLGQAGELGYLASPCDEGLYLAAVAPPLESREAYLADREGNFAAGIRAWPELADILAGASRTGPIRVVVNWHGYFREAAGPGWVLLGDAGHFKDPVPAQGMSDALRHGERLADVIEAGLGGEADIDDELRKWWRWRDEEGYEMHWLAADMGSADPFGPLAIQMLQDIAAEDTEGLLRVLNRDMLPSELFGWDRIGRAAVRAARKRPGQIPAMAKEAATALRNQVRRSRRRHRSPLPALS